MEDAGAELVVRCCEEALENSVSDCRFVVLHSPNVDSICAVKILLTLFGWVAPVEPTVRMVTTLQSLKDAVAGEQQCGPRVFFFVNCGGLEHEFSQLELMRGSAAVMLDNRRPKVHDCEVAGVDVRWMTFPGDRDSEVGTPASLCAFCISEAMSFQNEAISWYAIVGQNSIVQEGSARIDQIESWEVHLKGQAMCSESSRISHGEVFRLPFFHHSSLWDSIKMSGAIMAKMDAWKMHDNRDLADFVVELGIPTEKSKIPYGSFMVKYGENLKEKLLDRGPQWGLHDLCTSGFMRETSRGFVTADDHAQAVRSTLASCSGQCEPGAFLESIRDAVSVLTGGLDNLNQAIFRHRRLMPSILGAGYYYSRSRRKGLRSWDLDKHQKGVDKSPQWKCPFWLEIVAQHALDYSSDPIILVGQQMDDGLVAAVGWGNYSIRNGSEVKMRPVSHLMMDIALSMQSEGRDLESVAFQTNIWRMQRKTAKDFIIRVKRAYTKNTRIQTSGQKRHGDVADGVKRKESRTMLKGQA